ncbi:hypothetical protein GCM10027075_68260 [Streptomyces heilongjiangensis]
MGAASGTLGSVPTEFHSRAPAQDSTPATTNTAASVLMRSSFTMPFRRVRWSGDTGSRGHRTVGPIPGPGGVG